MYINSRWCTNIKVHERICNPDLELLTLSARAFYLPREFSTVVLSCVYVPPSANVKAAAEQVAHNTQAMLGKYPDAPVLILGDFNSCQLDYVLPAFKQYVDVPTRFNKTIDLCYSNIQEAYKARALPPLGLADHNVIHLLPVYKQRLKQHKPMIYSTLQWSEDAIARLQGCLACTDWDVFEGELDEQTLVISDYIKFCIDTLIPAKTIKTYPNSKPWINPQIKHFFYKKQLAFRQKDFAGLKIINRDIKREIYKAKQYKNKLEQDCANTNTKQAFQRVKPLTGQSIKQPICVADPITFATNLNHFYARFDTSDFTAECDSLLDSMPFQELDYESLLTKQDVYFQLIKCKPYKAPGPDGIPGRVLKNCALELTPILHSLFIHSLCTSRIPVIWKSSIVIPVPKK